MRGLTLAAALLVMEPLAQDLPPEPRHLQTATLNADRLIEGRDNAVYDVAVSSAGRLCVPDYRRDRLLWLDPDLRPAEAVGGTPTPHGVAFDPSGALYVATFRAGRVLKFLPDGKPVEGWDAELVRDKRLGSPVAVAADARGRVYIADYGLQRIVAADPDGRWLKDLRPPGEGGFLPHGLDTDGSRRLYAADRSTHAVQVFSLDGKHLGTWRPPSGEFDPLSVRAWAGLVLVPCYRDSRIHVFGSEGRWKSAFGGEGARDGLFLKPTSLAVGPGGTLFVVEEGGNRVQKLDASGLAKKRR